MSRVFAYSRVSTRDQSTDNQRRAVEATGFALDKRRIIEESISGSVAAARRPGVTKLFDRLEAGDVLVVTKLDRLRRNAMDVRETVERLAELGVRVHCLALGGADLASSARKMTMQVFCAVAEFERDLLIERTKSGLARVKAEWKALGRKPKLTPAQQSETCARLARAASMSQVARDYKTTRQTIMRARDRGFALKTR